MPLKVVSIESIGGGVNDYERPHNIAPSQMQNTSRNIRGVAGSYQQRGGYTTFADTLNNEKVLAFGKYFRNQDTDDKLIMVQDDRIWSIDPATESTWTEIENEVLTSQTSVNAMDATTGWVASTDAGIGIDTTTKREGTGSLELAKTGTSSTEASATLTVGATDFTGKIMNVWFYVKDQTTLDLLADTATFTLTLTDSGGGTHIQTFNKADLSITVATWEKFKVATSAMTASTSPAADITDITGIKIETTSTATGDTWAAGDLLFDYLHTTVATGDMEILSYRDWLFIFDGIDKPLRIAGSTVTQDFTQPASLSAATFLPAFGDVYGASLFVSGVPTAPNTVYVSKASTSANPEFVYDFSGALTSYGDANEILLQNRVTAIKKLSTAVVIFTVDEAIYIPGLKEFGTSVTFEVQPIGGSSGAVSQKSTTVVENDIYYLTPKKEIKSVKRGFSDTLSIMTTSLSTNIQQFLNDEIDDDLSSAWSYYDEANKLYKLHLRPKGGTTNLITLVADIEKVDQTGVPQWYIDDSRPFNSGIYYKGKNYVGSSQIGQAYNDEVGSADDDDAAIITKRVSKEFVANNPTAVKNYRQVVLYGEMTLTTVIAVKVYIDDELSCETTITAEDLPDQSTVKGGGIAVDTIGEFAIGTDGSETETSTSAKLKFTKRLNLRQTGKDMRIETSTDGTGNDYNIRYMEYGFLPKTYLYNPIIEK